jgi:hypothetical protein
VATLVDQLAHDAPQRLGADAATVERGIDEQVDRGVAVLRLELLGELDQARDRTVGLDREAGRLGLLPWEVRLRGVPPADDLGSFVDAP